MRVAVNPKVSNFFGSAVLGLIAVGLFAFTCATWGQVMVWSPPEVLEIGVFPIVFRVDDLTRVFALLLSALLLSVAFYSADYLKGFDDDLHRGRYWMCTFLFVSGMVGVTFSANAIGFILFWELMSLAAAALIASEHKQKKNRRAALIYLGTSRIASALIAAGFLCMHSLMHSWEFQAWDFSSPVTAISAALILMGLCIKSGMWPFHLWLPYAYQSAPAPISALMSGYMSKLAMLTLVRLLVIGHLQNDFLIGALFALSLSTGLWGIIFALVQTDLRRVIAYSSIENMGLILLCISTSLLAARQGITIVSTIALIAALLHCFNHGMFKALLFLSAGAIEKCARSAKLNNLGGLARRMPVTTLCFFIASFAAASLPPLNGFFGKWLLYRSLFDYICLSNDYAQRAISLIVICALSSIGALALLTFAKLLAVPLLGKPRTAEAAHAHESSKSMQVGQLLLAFACVASGFVVDKAVHLLQSSLGEFSASADVVQFSLPINPIYAALAVLMMLIYFGMLKGSKYEVYKTWDCGFGEQSVKSQVTAESFAQPAARIFRPLFSYKNFSKIEGSDWRHFPEQIEVETSVISILETKVYAPTLKLVRASSKLIAKLQAGSIHLYLFYVCTTLVVLLILGAFL